MATIKTTRYYKTCFNYWKLSNNKFYYRDTMNKYKWMYYTDTIDKTFVDRFWARAEKYELTAEEIFLLEL